MFRSSVNMVKVLPEPVAIWIRARGSARPNDASRARMARA